MQFARVDQQNAEADTIEVRTHMPAQIAGILQPRDCNTEQTVWP